MVDRVTIYVKGSAGIEKINQCRGAIPLSTAIKRFLDYVAYDSDYIRTILGVKSGP
jgi:hypothetical protein